MNPKNGLMAFQFLHSVNYGVFLKTLTFQSRVGMKILLEKPRNVQSKYENPMVNI